MLEPGKFYTNNLGNKYRCLEIVEDLVKMWVLVEVPAEKGLFALKKNGQRELVREITAEIKQNIKYSSQYKVIEDPQEIKRLSELYNKENLQRAEKPVFKRSDVWRLQYRKRRRYLEHLTDEELGQRLRDIMGNTMVLKEDGRIGFVSLEKGGGYWLEKFTHVHEEYCLRGQNFPAGVLKNVNIHKPTYPDPPKSVAAIEGRVFKEGTFLVKYGKACFMKLLFDEGQIQIKPASMYDDPSLNCAIRDNELSRTIYKLPSEVRINVIDKNTGKPSAEIKPIGNIANTSQCVTNYYLYCFSCFYDHRLFSDFNYDACVIIKQPFEFEKILNAAFIKLFPDWTLLKSRVAYIDPLNAKNPEDDSPFFTKHFRYAYQYEFRFIWLPPIDKPVKSLNVLNLNLGSLKDIAELVIL
jgi:hypothetical protein